MARDLYYRDGRKVTIERRKSLPDDGGMEVFHRKSGFFGYPVAFFIFLISYLCIVSGCNEHSWPAYPLSYMVVGTVVEKGSDSTIANAIVVEKLPGISDSLCISADTLIRNDTYYRNWSRTTNMYHTFLFDYRQNTTPDYPNFRASAPGYHYWKYDAARDTVFKLDGVDSLCIRLIKK